MNFINSLRKYKTAVETITLMDQPTVGEETFILKTNIHCKGCEKKLRKLLQNIRGVDKISVDAEQGRITISGYVDPKKLTEYLQKKLKNSVVSWEPVVAKNDLEMIRNHQLIHDEDAVQLQKLSEIKGLKTVEVSRSGMKITYKEDANARDLAGKNAYSAATSLDQQRGMHKKYYYDEDVMHNNCHFQDNHYCCCSRNQAMYRQCTYMASQGNISLGIPVQDYIPSAPPVSEHYYPDPPQQEKPYHDYPFDTEFSDDYPTACFIM